MPRKKPSDIIIERQRRRDFDNWRAATQPLRMDTVTLDKGDVATNVRPGLKNSMKTIDSLAQTRRKV